MQDSSYLILKYRPEVVFYDLWNEFYMETRGVVIDHRQNGVNILSISKVF